MSYPNFQGSSDDVSLSPGQAKFLYWFIGTVPILKAMTSITTYRGNMKSVLKEIAKSNNPTRKLVETDFRKIYTGVVSDFSRQTVTCSFQLMSYFVVGDAIKAILKQVYSKKPPDQQDLGMQQVLMQTIPLTVQVIATILSRNFGASELQSFVDVNSITGKYTIPAKETGLSLKIRTFLKNFIETSLTDQKTKCLRPLKASIVGTGAMMGYFAVLVGLLYGISSGLEKAFPGTFKTKQQSKKEEPQKPAAPAPLNLTSQAPMYPVYLSRPVHSPFMSPLSFSMPQMAFTGRLPVSPLLYSRH